MLSLVYTTLLYLFTDHHMLGGLNIYFLLARVEEDGRGKGGGGASEQAKFLFEPAHDY